MAVWCLLIGNPACLDVALFCYHGKYFVMNLNFKKYFQLEKKRDSHSDIDIDRHVSILEYLAVFYIIENYFFGYSNSKFATVTVILVTFVCTIVGLFVLFVAYL